MIGGFYEIIYMRNYASICSSGGYIINYRSSCISCRPRN